MKGNIPWNKDKNHPKYELYLETIKKKSSKSWFKKGQVAWNKGMTKESHPELITYGLCGDKNPSKRPEVRKKMSESAIKKIIKNPELHPNRMMANKGKVSKPQIQLYNIIEFLYGNKHLESNFYIKCEKSRRFGDVVLTDKKIVFEFNGSYWHIDEAADLSRKLEIEEQGYEVIFLDEIRLKELQNVFADVPKHILDLNRRI